MARYSALGWVNYFKTGTVSADSSVADLGPTNLASDLCSPETGWQTADGVVSAAGGALLRCDSPVAGLLWRGFCLVNTNLTAAAVVTATLYRSAGPTSVASLTVGGPQTGYRQVVGFFSQDETADYIEFAINDATNPDNNINVGGAFVGPAWFPDRGVGWDTTYGENVARTDTRARGGPRYINTLYVERYWQIALDAVRNSEAWDDLGELKRIAALGGNVLFAPDVTSVDLSREAVFGVLETQADVSFQSHSTDARAYRAQITERL